MSAILLFLDHFVEIDVELSNVLIFSLIFSLASSLALWWFFSVFFCPSIKGRYLLPTTYQRFKLNFLSGKSLVFEGKKVKKKKLIP